MAECSRINVLYYYLSYHDSICVNIKTVVLEDKINILFSTRLVSATHM